MHKVTLRHMAALQGLKRLKLGAYRKLTNSEAKRGYIFITLDQEVRRLLGEEFSVKIGEKVLKNKHIDSSGRISVGVDLAQELKDKDLKFKLNGDHLIIE